MSKADEYRFEMARIKSAVLLALFMTISCAMLFALSWSFYTDKKNKDTQAEQQLRNVRGAISQHQSIKGMVDAYSDRYADMSDAGYFRNDHKLVWLEHIRQAADQLKLPGIQYTIGQQKPFNDEQELGSTDLGVYKSTIDLRLSLLHEVDLLSLIQFFDNADLGLYNLESCSLKKLSQYLPESSSEALIEASCKIGSYSFVFNDERTFENDDIAMVH